MLLSQIYLLRRASFSCKSMVWVHFHLYGILQKSLPEKCTACAHGSKHEDVHCNVVYSGEKMGTA